MTETELLEAITAECDRLGLIWHHCGDSRKCQGTPGLPDLVIASVNGVIFAELKGPDGETSADQDLWIHALYMGGLRPRVWRPHDSETGSINIQLAMLAYKP